MSESLKKKSQDDFQISQITEEQQAKINEVRRLVGGPLPEKLATYCSDASISRYLRARNWNVKKATKMLKESLKWRKEYKPEEIRWEEVALEAETGKIYRSNCTDKLGRVVLVMRPSCQNTKSMKGQIKYLVYCMENAILNLPHDQEQMVWLIDFRGFGLSHISLKVTRETANVLQNHYPERLGMAVMYNAPKFFEPFWMVAKAFLEQKTFNKVKFVYSDVPDTMKIMEDIFDMDSLEPTFGGKAEAGFEISNYAERMRDDDKKIPSFWAKGSLSSSAQQPTPTSLDSLNLDDASDNHLTEASPSHGIGESSPIKDGCMEGLKDVSEAIPGDKTHS